MKRALVFIFLGFGMSYASLVPVDVSAPKLTEIKKSPSESAEEDAKENKEPQVPIHAFRCPSCLG